MLLAPIVAFMLREKSIDVSAEEEGFVRSYLRYGYWIIMIVILALLVWTIYTLFFDLTILYRINYCLLGIAIAMILIGMFSIINNKMVFRHAKYMAKGTEQIHHDTSVISYFMPLYNYYMRYNEPLDDHNYWRVKESVLWRSIYIIAISIRPNISLIAGGFFLIVARMIMLAADMDIISMELKHKLNTLFSHNIEELIAYPLALITNIIKKIFQKKSSLTTEIASRKLTYAQLDSLSHWRTIVQYLIAVAAIGYRGYTTRITSGPTV